VGCDSKVNVCCSLYRAEPCVTQVRLERGKKLVPNLLSSLSCVLSSSCSEIS